MTTTFGPDLSAFTLDELRVRLASDDLLPSHRILRDGLEHHFAVLAELGIANVQQLVDLLPSAQAVEKAAAQSGIPVAYLTILRRHVRGYIPSPVALAEIPETEPALVQALADAGIKNTKQLYLRARTRTDRAALAATLGIASAALIDLMELTDLSRIGWIGPIGVRWFRSAGVASVTELAAADPDQLHARLLQVNQEHDYTKVKLGRKDVAMTVAAARRLPATIEF